MTEGMYDRYELRAQTRVDVGRIRQEVLAVNPDASPEELIAAYEKQLDPSQVAEIRKMVQVDQPMAALEELLENLAAPVDPEAEDESQ